MAIAVTPGFGTYSAAGGSTSLTLTGIVSDVQVVNGDVLALGIGWNDDTPGSSISISNGIGTWVQAATLAPVGTHRHDLWYCVVTNSAGATPVVSWTDGSRCRAIASGYTGVDTTTPSDVAASTNSATSSTLSASSITTVTPGAMLVASYCQQGNGATGKFSSPTSPLVEVAESGDAAEFTVGLYDGLTVGAGATGAKTVTSTQNQLYTAFLWALRPYIAPTYTPRLALLGVG